MRDIGCKINCMIDCKIDYDICLSTRYDCQQDMAVTEIWLSRMKEKYKFVRIKAADITAVTAKYSC